MAVPIFVRPKETGLSETLGQALGTGIGGLAQGVGGFLQNLAQLKMQDVAQRQQSTRTASALQELLGLSPEQAQAASYAPESVLREYTKQKFQQPTYQQEANTLQQLLNYLDSNQDTSTSNVNFFDQAGIRPGQALPIASFVAKQKQHQEDIAQRRKEFDIGKVQPRQQELQNRYNDLTNQFQTYQELSRLNKTGQIRGGIFGFGKPEESTLFETLLESLVPYGATKAQIESARKKLPTLNQTPKVRQQLIDYNLRKLQSELNQLQQHAQLLNYQPAATQEDVSPNSNQVFNEIISQTPGSPIDKLSQSQSPQAKTAMSNQLSQEQQSLGNNAENVVGYLGRRALKGAGEGLTSLIGLPFNVANLLSLGNIPVPETIKNIENLPEQTIDSLFGKIEPRSEGEKFLGNFVEDLTSLLTPGGAISKLGKVGKLAKLEKLGNFLNVSPRAAATISAAGNLANLATQKVGGTQAEGSLAKAGTMLAVPLIGTRLASRQVNNLAQEAAQAIKDTDVVRSPSLLKANMKFYEDLTKGVSTPIKEEVIKAIEPLFLQTAPAEMNLKDIFSAKQVVTKASQDPEFARSMKNFLPTFTRELDKALVIGSKVNPQFGQFFEEFNDLSSALKTTNVVSDFAKKYLGATRYKDPISYGILALTLRGLTGMPLYKSIGAIGLPAFTLAEVQRMLKIAMRSPAFRKYYGDYITSAARGSVKKAQYAARKLDNVIVNENKKIE